MTVQTQTTAGTQTLGGLIVVKCGSSVVDLGNNVLWFAYTPKVKQRRLVSQSW